MKIDLENQDYTFILADMGTPRADLLHANGLLVDLQSQRLINASAFASSKLRPSTQTSLGLHHIASVDPRVYLNSSPRSPVLNFQVLLFGTVWNIASQVPTTGPPVNARARGCSERWKKRASYADRTARGRLPCTWI